MSKKVIVGIIFFANFVGLQASHEAAVCKVACRLQSNIAQGKSLQEEEQLSTAPIIKSIVYPVDHEVDGTTLTASPDTTVPTTPLSELAEEFCDELASITQVQRPVSKLATRYKMDIAHAQSLNEEQFRNSPLVKAAFYAINNGADGSIVRTLRDKAISKSPSPEVTQEFCDEVLAQCKLRTCKFLDKQMSENAQSYKLWQINELQRAVQDLRSRSCSSGEFTDTIVAIKENYKLYSAANSLALIRSTDEITDLQKEIEVTINENKSVYHTDLINPWPWVIKKN